MLPRAARQRRTGLGGLLCAGLGLLAAGAAAQEPELDCLIEPQETVMVSAPVEAVVAEVLVERGDIVEEGQVVARLESSLERATVAAARARARAQGELQASEARLAFETRRKARNSQLSDRGVISDHEKDEVESAVVMAKAERLRARENAEQAALDLERAEAVLELRTVRSPIAGVVVRRIIAPGEYADPPELIELAQIDPLRVEAFAPVSLLGRIERGMHAEIALEEPLGGSYDAKVTVVDRVVDAASGTFGVRLELPNPDHALPAGVRCRARFAATPAPPPPVASAPTSAPPPSAASSAGEAPQSVAATPAPMTEVALPAETLAAPITAPAPTACQSGGSTWR
jgi:RND family efflux transporter MFP subunit